MVNGDNNLTNSSNSLSLEQQLEIEYTNQFFFKDYKYTPKELKLSDAYNKIVYAPDIHTNTWSYDAGIRKLQKEARGKQSVIVIGDSSDRREHLANLYQEFNIPTLSMVKANYIAQKLNVEDARSFALVDQINSSYGSLEGYIQNATAMGHRVSDTLEQEYNNALTHYKNNNLENKVKKLCENDEYKEIEKQIKIMGEVVDYANAKVLAKEKAKILYDANLDALYSGLGETITIEEGGNHGSLYDTILFREEYDKLVGNDPNMSKSENVIYNALELHGSIDLGSNENEFSFQIANNCPNNFPGLVGEIFSEIQTQMLFPQCFDNTLSLGYSPSQYSQLDENEMFRNSQDAIRMSGLALHPEQTPKKVNMVLLHDERGMPVGYENTINPQSRITNLGLEVYINNFVEKDQNGNVRVASGHWHKDTNGIITDNEWNQNKSRHFMARLDKNGTADDYNIDKISGDFDYQAFEQIFQEELQRATQISQTLEQKLLPKDENSNKSE